MKYLKTYESLKDPNDCLYYQSIDHYEWEKLMGTTGVRIGTNKVSFTAEERSELDELLFNNRINYEFDKKIMAGTRHLEIRKGNDIWFIEKVKDEWFLATNQKIKEIYSKNYKCDQFDGLIKLIEDLII